MQHGSARPLAVTYITFQGRRHRDQGEPSVSRRRLIPGSLAAPDAEKVSPSARATASASDR